MAFEDFHQRVDRERQEAGLRARGWEQDHAGRWITYAEERDFADQWFPPTTTITIHDRLMGVIERWNRKHASDLQFSDEDHYEGARRKTRGGVWPKEKQGVAPISINGVRVLFSEKIPRGEVWMFNSKNIHIPTPTSADFEDLTKT